MKFVLHSITAESTPEQQSRLQKVHELFVAYQKWLDVDLCFQGFDAELAGLPGAYVPPRGRLFYLEMDGKAAGCIGLRPLDETTCEIKRLFVIPECRGRGLGQKLVLATIKAAREIGYQRMLLDTLPKMPMALKLYRELGFRDTPPYYETPHEGTVFLALDLTTWSEADVSRENLFHLFDFNRAWSQEMQASDPDFFSKLAHLQAPEYLWIGCSDSRVPANQIVGLMPGEVFVHRNVANVVVHTDLNCLSVIQFAVDVLKVKHIMVVGHYGCGGVHAALNDLRAGLVDLWLRHVKDVRVKHNKQILAAQEDHRHDLLCELNVIEQVLNVCHSMIVQDAWTRGQELTVHGWIYGLNDGLMRDLGLTVSKAEDADNRYRTALAALN
ncbi:MAG: carbonate dehydratase [Rhodocyclaceae bacterium]|nr:carbonate dehydratase [Rhodocyclaceae bacterium]